MRDRNTLVLENIYDFFASINSPIFYPIIDILLIDTNNLKLKIMIIIIRSE